MRGIRMPRGFVVLGGLEERRRVAEEKGAVPLYVRGWARKFPYLAGFHLLVCAGFEDYVEEAVEAVERRDVGKWEETVFFGLCRLLAERRLVWVENGWYADPHTLNLLAKLVREISGDFEVYISSGREVTVPGFETLKVGGETGKVCVSDDLLLRGGYLPPEVFGAWRNEEDLFAVESLECGGVLPDDRFLERRLEVGGSEVERARVYDVFPSFRERMRNLPFTALSSLLFHLQDFYLYSEFFSRFSEERGADYEPALFCGVDLDARTGHRLIEFFIFKMGEHGDGRAAAGVEVVGEEFEEILNSIEEYLSSGRATSEFTANVDAVLRGKEVEAGAEPPAGRFWLLFAEILRNVYLGRGVSDQLRELVEAARDTGDMMRVRAASVLSSVIPTLYRRGIGGVDWDEFFKDLAFVFSGYQVLILSLVLESLKGTGMSEVCGTEGRPCEEVRERLENLLETVRFSPLLKGIGYLALARYEFLKSRSFTNKAASYASLAWREVGKREDCVGAVCRLRALEFGGTKAELTGEFESLWKEVKEKYPNSWLASLAGMHFLRHLCFVGMRERAKEVVEELVDVVEPMYLYVGRAVYDFFGGNLLRSLYSASKAVLFSKSTPCYVLKMVFSYVFLAGVESGEYEETLKRLRGLAAGRNFDEREKAHFDVAVGLVSLLNGEGGSVKRLRKLLHRYNSFPEEEWKLLGMWEVNFLFPEVYEEYLVNLKRSFEERGLEGGLAVLERIRGKMENLKLIVRGDGE